VPADHFVTATIYQWKEIENFVLVPSAIDRAAAKRVADQAKRSARELRYAGDAAMMLEEFSAQKKAFVMAQHLAYRRRHYRSSTPSISDETITERGLLEFEESWRNIETRLGMMPGKEALSFLNQKLQQQYGVTVSPTAIIDAMFVGEIAEEMKEIISSLHQFALSNVD
jgi:hypothetical protein